MYCKKCGSALPSHGFICLQCGTMMDGEQIKEQKTFNQNKNEINFVSDQYRKEPIIRDYKKRKEYKLVGVLFILVILFALIIIAILKVK